MPKKNNNKISDYLDNGTDQNLKDVFFWHCLWLLSFSSPLVYMSSYPAGCTREVSGDKVLSTSTSDSQCTHRGTHVTGLKLGDFVNTLEDVTFT
ncbi:hypothetical protein E2I00_014589 [Balaenoptera physalus]|uniref:Uncharacterized protein n=1 Tax=Balaenoptera physalus TaxID=9770 RepID=A0A643C632_BALPH|nr:hypothetical protein E2I00_014589 [Balaenoptera physalus]